MIFTVSFIRNNGKRVVLDVNSNSASTRQEAGMGDPTFVSSSSLAHGMEITIPNTVLLRELHKILQAMRLTLPKALSFWAAAVSQCSQLSPGFLATVVRSPTSALQPTLSV